MQISRLYIEGFRSIRELDLRFPSGKTVIIGRNNAGKSNIVRALDLVLGESSPTWQKRENITEEDFYCWRDKSNRAAPEHRVDEIVVWCELQRSDGEPLPYEDMYEAARGIWLHAEQGYNGKPLRIPGNLPPSEAGYLFEFDPSRGGRHYVNANHRDRNPLESLFEPMYSFAFVFLARRGTRRIEKEMRFLFREHAEAGWFLALSAPYRTELVQSAIVPAFRDPANQLRLTDWSWYGKLMRHLTEPHAEEDNVRDAFAQVRTAAQTVFERVETEIGSTLDVAFPGTSVHFQFHAEESSSLYKNSTIYVDDGYRSQLSDKGSGIQSATILGLFNYYTLNVNTRSSALLCVEEPELYLHPHARRVISDRLDAFLDSGRNQVVLTTHSVDFLRASSDTFNVILVRRSDRGTEGASVPIRDFRQLLVDNNQNELFFADKVILCEGFDKYVIEAAANALYPGELDAQNVSVIGVGGKDNLSRLAKLVVRLGIECYVLADFDYLLRDKLPEREVYNAPAHDSVLNLGIEFLSQECLFGTKGRWVQGVIEKVRNQIKKVEPEAFYTAVRASQIEEEEASKQIDRLIQGSRSWGLCILSGQIEDAFTDPYFVGAGKLTLEKVYDLNKRLASGTPAGSLLDLSEIDPFLEKVLSPGTKS